MASVGVAILHLSETAGLIAPPARPWWRAPPLPHISGTTDCPCFASAIVQVARFQSSHRWAPLRDCGADSAARSSLAARTASSLRASCCRLCSWACVLAKAAFDSRLRSCFKSFLWTDTYLPAKVRITRGCRISNSISSLVARNVVFMVDRNCTIKPGE